MIYLRKSALRAKYITQISEYVWWESRVEKTGIRCMVIKRPKLTVKHDYMVQVNVQRRN
jgi:hypothetical protein